MVNSSGAEGGAGGGGGGDTGIDGGAGGSGGGTQHPTVPPTASGLLQLGCGPSGLLTLHVTTTTGRSFSVIVDSEKTVVHLKKVISKNLKVSKDRICLLHRERVLHDGTLRENGLVDGSKIILTPNVETGLLTQRAENTVMQALESLNDKQVNDFLSGKSPLNLSVRLGDHMMLIQLQLSTLSPSSSQAATIGAGGMSFSGGGRIKASTSSSAATAAVKPQQAQHHHHHHHHHHRVASGASSGSTLAHSPEVVGSLALGGHNAIGNNQHQQLRHQSAQVPASATNSITKANMLARRPVASSVAPGDVAEDGLEQPALKRPARLESNRGSESVKTLPQSGCIASTSNSCNSNTLYKSASLAKNNNDHCTGENNNSNRNDSNISNITRHNRTTINFHEDQQQGNVARIQQQNEEMEHDDEKKKEETNNGEKLAHILASEEVGGASNNLQTTAPVAVSSPIKSLSKLVSARIIPSDAEKDANVATSRTTADLDFGDDRSATSDARERDAGISECSDPITANLTSCLCRRLDGGGGSDDKKGNKVMGRNPAPSESNPSLLHRTALNPISKHKAKLQGMGKKTPTLLAASAAYVGEGGRTDGQSERTPPSLGTARTSGGEQRSLLYPNELTQQQNAPLLSHRLQQEQQQNSFAGAGRRLLFSTVDCAQQKHQPPHQQIGSRTKCLTYIADPPSPLKNPALAEASRNLTQTLRKLSKRVFTSNVTSPTALSSPGGSSSSSSASADTSSVSSSLAQSSSGTSSGKSSSSSFLSPSTPSSAQSAPSSLPCSSSGGRGASSGAVIESMKHHGKGIYSGTFSGTLNPALQDKFGRPKRDISTIIHILNDLLSAAPQCATSEANAGGSSLSTSSTSSSNSSGTKIYFDPKTSPTGSSVVVTGTNDASTGDFVVAGSSGGSSSQRHNCNHHYQSNRSSARGPADGGSSTSWFVPAPPGSKKSQAEETKNVSKKLRPESGLALPHKKSSTSVATGIEEDTLTASRSMNRGGMIADGACVGCKLPSGSTNSHGGGSSSGYRSLLLSSLDGSTSSTKFVPLSPLASNGGALLLCKCGSTMLAPDSSCGGAVQPQQQCKLCIMKAVEMENSKTKLKLDSLRLIMKQKRERREARKLQSAPYQGTPGAVSPRNANDATPRPSKIAKVPVNSSSHNSHVTAAQKRNEGAVGINSNRLSEHQQSQRQQPGHEHHNETETLSPILVLKQTAQLDSTRRPTEQGQLSNKSSVEGALLQNTHPEEPTTNSSTTEADVPFSNPTDTGEAVNTDETIPSDSSEATKATPETPSPSSAADAASSASTDASTNTGATHLVEEVDSVA